MTAALPAPRATRRVSAETLGRGQRDISIAEFFAKNRHLLGFDSPQRALLTAVKEAVDNALDACEDAGILPKLRVEIEPVSAEVLKVTVEDNGPGIVEQQIAKIFGKLLYGSKFHKLAQSRGQQGIGISAAGLYAQLTTGKPMRIVSKTGPRKPAWEFVLSIDTRRNRPDLHTRRRVDWTVPHGTRVELELVAAWHQGAHSVAAYLEQVAMANPHVSLVLEDPEGNRTVHRATSRRLPARAQPIQPHPHGVELGVLAGMLRDTTRRTLIGFLAGEFSRIGRTTATEILRRARLEPAASPRRLPAGAVTALHRAMAQTHVSAPSTDCVVPLGERALLAALRRGANPPFVTATTRAAAVYRGNPFVVEVGLAYDGTAATPDDRDEPLRLLRFANRVPMLFQQGACAITRAVIDTHWHTYGLAQPKGGLPTGPVTLLVHVASVWVPFTSEAKDAIAGYPEILHELRLALQECGRALGAFLRHARQRREQLARVQQLDAYVPHIGAALQELLALDGTARRATEAALHRVLTRAPQGAKP